MQNTKYVSELINNIKMKKFREFMMLECKYHSEEQLLKLDFIIDINKIKNNKYLEYAIMRIISHQDLEIIIPILEEWSCLIKNNNYDSQMVIACFYISKMISYSKEKYDQLISYFYDKNPDICELFKIIKKFYLYN